MGTPIRLVRNDGGIIELMATTLIMNVDRGVTPLPMPFAGGSRFAFDLNLPKALIEIEGVMTNDDLLNIGELERAASAVIDFSRTAVQPNNSALQWNLFAATLVKNVTLDNAGTATHAIDITTSGGVVRKVYLAKQSSTFEGLHGGSGRYFVAVHDGTNVRTASQIAASFTSLINSYSGIFNLSANQINSPLSGESSTAVEITQTVGGTFGNKSHPSFSEYPSAVGNAATYKPYHIQYSGGRNSSAVSNKSAGDKVAELFAVLNNSNNGGGGSLTTTGLVGSYLTAQSSPASTGNPFIDTALGQDLKYGDYIIGIQIPFSSSVNDRESLFYMPTGGTMDIFDKTADKAPATGVEFQPYNSEYTGIKGAVANATFTQLGGEPMYTYKINFVPIDWIF
jgi:hypothetical protein